MYTLTKDSGPSNNEFDVYSAVIPSLNEIGTHKIKLELEWDNHNYKLSTVSNVEVKPFPVLTINPGSNQKTPINQRTKIGTLSSHINESAYPVKQDQIEFIVASDNESRIQIEIVPTDIYPGNTASEYDIFAKPDTNDNFTLYFNLKGEYSGQSYFYVGDQVTFNSIPAKGIVRIG